MLGRAAPSASRAIHAPLGYVIHVRLSCAALSWAWLPPQPEVPFMPCLAVWPWVGHSCPINQWGHSCPARLCSPGLGMAVPLAMQP